jgi:hypothetical protein
MFIDREAFILDFQRREFNGQFCSPALVNAVCAVGALMSSDELVRGSADRFSETAENILLGHGMRSAHSTSVQALLCCAFFEIGRGNIFKCWMYSGKHSSTSPG